MRVTTRINIRLSKKALILEILYPGFQNEKGLRLSMDPSDPLCCKSSHESTRQFQILYLFNQTNVNMTSSSPSRIAVRSLGERVALFQPLINTILAKQAQDSGSPLFLYPHLCDVTGGHRIILPPVHDFPFHRRKTGKSKQKSIDRIFCNHSLADDVEVSSHLGI